MTGNSLTRAMKSMFAVVLLVATASAAAAAGKEYTVKSSDGVVIAVEETGNPQGWPIVFIHGLLGSRINWDKQTSSPDLQKFRIITYDLRGHGCSGSRIARTPTRMAVVGQTISLRC